MSAHGRVEPGSIRYAVSRTPMVRMTQDEWRRAQRGEVVLLTAYAEDASDLEWVSLFQTNLVACRGSEPQPDRSQRAAIAVVSLFGRADATDEEIEAELGPLVAGALGTRYVRRRPTRFRRWLDVAWILLALIVVAICLQSGSTTRGWASTIDGFLAGSWFYVALVIALGLRRPRR